MTHNKIKQSFNKAAKSYDNYCDLQLQTGRKLISLTKEHCLNSSRIIDLGCGTGLITRELASALNYENFHAIDFADQLIIKAKKQLSQYNINVYESDYDSFNEEHFDILFSNLALHWSPNFTLTLKTLKKAFSKQGIFAFSIPLSGSLHELQPFAVKHFMDESAVLDIINISGYHLKACVTEQMIFNFDNFLQALKSIKGVGANSTDKQSGSGAHSLIKHMIKSSEKVSLTYKIGYFIVNHHPFPL